MSNVFGFSTEAAPAGDFTPIVKYDARAGRVFRVDRGDNGSGFENDPVDITANFKAVFDFENIEVGWINFPAGSAPSFALVPMGQQLPDRPSPLHKNGIRMLIKLAPACGGDKPVREIAGTSKAFLSGVEAVYAEYAKAKDANAGKLPVIVLERTTPVSSGSGERKSTNYHPVFKIVGWAQRPQDLEAKPRAATPVAAPVHSTPPSTGSSAPTAKAPAPAPQMADDDFG